MKTKKEVVEELAEIEEKQFRLMMIDKWDDSDYEFSNELHKKQMELKTELEKIQNLTLSEKIDIAIEKIQKEIEEKKLTWNVVEIEKLSMKIDVLNDFREEWR